MKKLIAIILLMYMFPVFGQEYVVTNRITLESKSISDYDIAFDTVRVKILMYSERHNGAICVDGYLIKSKVEFIYEVIEFYFDRKWEPIDNTKVFSWIRYEWKDAKKKKGIF